MKTIDEYINLPYKMELTPDIEEGGFVISFPELPGCISAGDTVEEAYVNAVDAKHAWLEAAIDNNVVITEPSDIDDYSGQFKLRIFSVNPR